MSNVLINAPNDPTVASVALGYNTQAAANALSAISIPEYTFPEPKTGLVATVFPGENTWHSLYDHDYREIANHLFSIGSMNVDQNTKTALANKVKEVTIQSYEMSAMGMFYKIVIVSIIVLLILIFVQNSNPGKKMPLFEVGIVGAILAVGALLYAKLFAKGAGESYWQQFSSDLNGKITTGRLPGDILKEYGADVERERDRAAMARVQRAGLTVAPATGALIGGLLGGMFR